MKDNHVKLLFGILIIIKIFLLLHNKMVTKKWKLQVLVESLNSLLNTVVSAESTNTFKNRLDKFCANQAFKFDLNADITGIGSRSINIYV